MKSLLQKQINQIRLVSVLLPVYNGEAYLAQAIQCILDQTYRNFELIIINDGSTDGSRSVINQFQDARLRVYDQENQGLAATLNRAISLAKGEFLARQDQDDVSLPQRFEKQVSFLESHPGHGMVGTWAKILYGENKAVRFHRHPPDNLILKFELLFNNPFVHSSMMLRKSAIKKAGMYSTDRSRQPPEDYELWSRMARVCRVANIPEFLVLYRAVPTSMSHTGVNPFLEKLIRISAENIAFATDRSADDRLCINLAALANGAYDLLSKKPRFRELASLYYQAVEKLCISEEDGNCCIRGLAKKRFHSLFIRYVFRKYSPFVGRVIYSLRLTGKETTKRT